MILQAHWKNTFQKKEGFGFFITLGDPPPWFGKRPYFSRIFFSAPFPKNMWWSTDFPAHLHIWPSDPWDALVLKYWKILLLSSANAPLIRICGRLIFHLIAVSDHLVPGMLSFYITENSAPVQCQYAPVLRLIFQLIPVSDHLVHHQQWVSVA